MVEALLLHLGTAVPAQSFIGRINQGRHMVKALAEEAEALGFDLLKLLAAFSGHSGAGIKD